MMLIQNGDDDHDDGAEDDDDAGEDAGDDNGNVYVEGDAVAWR